MPFPLCESPLARGSRSWQQVVAALLPLAGGFLLAVDLMAPGVRAAASAVESVGPSRPGLTTPPAGEPHPTLVPQGPSGLTGPTSTASSTGAAGPAPALPTTLRPQAPATTAAPVPPASAAGNAAAPVPWPSLGELLALPGWMRLSLTLNAAPIANPIGGLTAAANWMQQNELNLAVGSGLALDPSHWRGELDHWQLRLRVDAYNGQPDFGNTIGSIFAPQTMAFPQGFYLSGLQLQRSSRDQALQISAGVQSLDQDFLVAPAYTSYLYSGFNDTLNLRLPGLPITPYAAPALVLRWHSQGLGRWGVGAYWLDQETELAGLLGAPTAATPDLRGSLLVLQWDLPLWERAAWLEAPIPLAGGGTVVRQLAAPLLQLGALRSSAAFTTPNPSAPRRSVVRNHVLFSSLTLPLQLPLGLDNRIWGTLQWGLNPAQNPTPLFLSGGWQCQGPVPGRPHDVLSLGLGRTGFSPQLLPSLSWAGALELNYSVQINRRLSLQPVLQWLLRPSGAGSVPAILTTGLQLNLSL